MISPENKQWLVKKLNPGSYTFKHARFGDISLEMIETPGEYLKSSIRVSGSRLVTNEHRKKVRVSTITKFSSGINLDGAMRGLSADIITMIANYSFEGELTEDCAVFVKDGQPVMTFDDKISMNTTGSVPSRLRRSKIDSF